MLLNLKSYSQLPTLNITAAFIVVHSCFMLVLINATRTDSHCYYNPFSKVLSITRGPGLKRTCVEYGSN